MDIARSNDTSSLEMGRAIFQPTTNHGNDQSTERAG